VSQGRRQKIFQGKGETENSTIKPPSTLSIASAENPGGTAAPAVKFCSNINQWCSKGGGASGDTRLGVQALGRISTLFAVIQKRVLSINLD